VLEDPFRAEAILAHPNGLIFICVKKNLIISDLISCCLEPKDLVLGYFGLLCFWDELILLELLEVITPLIFIEHYLN